MITSKEQEELINTYIGRHATRWHVQCIQSGLLSKEGVDVSAATISYYTPKEPPKTGEELEKQETNEACRSYKARFAEKVLDAINDETSLIWSKPPSSADLKMSRSR